MVSGKSAGTGLLLILGLLLALLMAYTLLLDPGGPGPVGASSAAEVAVVFPERADWLGVRQGIAACEDRHLLRVVRDEGDGVIVETPRAQRRIRFAWRQARGSVETREVVRRLLTREAPPLAVVGSVNTALTADLAAALQADSPEAGGPVLLVPWATSVAAELPAGSRRVPLLEIYPRRTFRFCPNNFQYAGLLIDCLGSRGPDPRPGRVVLVSDPADPYSSDLATCFGLAIQRAAPSTLIDERTDVVAAPHMGEAPGAAELRWARETWAAAQGDPDGAPTWIVLPLQAEPTRRVIAALQASAPMDGPPDGGDGPIRVLCGDGIGLETLTGYVGLLDFPIWGVAPTSILASSGDLARDAQIPAEIVSAVAHCLDVPPGGSADLRADLCRLRLAPGDPSAFGRSLAFDPSGERRGDDIGQVLAVRPGRNAVLAFERGPDGTWGRPVPLPAGTGRARP